MAGNSPSDKKVQILGLGVTAFSALCTVLAAMITAGFFFVGRATAPGTTPAVSVTATSGGSQPSRAPHANGGTVIGQFTDFALSSGYGILESGTPSYETCTRDTAYTNTVHQVSTNQVICFTGHGVIAAITIKKVVDGPTYYVVLDATVWQAS